MADPRVHTTRAATREGQMRYWKLPPQRDGDCSMGCNTSLSLRHVRVWNGSALLQSCADGQVYTAMSVLTILIY